MRILWEYNIKWKNIWYYTCYTQRVKKSKLYINEFCRNIFEMYAWIVFMSLLKDTIDVEVRWYFSNKLTFVIKKNTQRLVRENNIKVICKEEKKITSKLFLFNACREVPTFVIVSKCFRINGSLIKIHVICLLFLVVSQYFN